MILYELAGLVSPSADFPWPTLPVGRNRLRLYLEACEDACVGYHLGAKANSFGQSLTAFPPRYSQIDCSGWVRAALAYATRGEVILPDGSVNQHDWCAGKGLKASTYRSLLLDDGVLRIAFIVPSAAHPVGHVFLCRGRKTMESWGGNGPGTRSPLVHVLHALTTAVFVITPTEAP